MAQPLRDQPASPGPNWTLWVSWIAFALSVGIAGGGTAHTDPIGSGIAAAIGLPFALYGLVKSRAFRRAAHAIVANVLLFWALFVFFNDAIFT